MFNIKGKIKNYPQFKREIKSDENRMYKAAIDSLKITGYWLKNRLQKEIIEGAPGGKRVAQMRHISQLSREYQSIYGSRLWDKTGIPKPGMQAPALRSLAIPIRYLATRNSEKFNVKVGVTRFKGTSDSWRKIFIKQQEGFQVPLTPLVRRAFYTWPTKIGEKPIGFKKGKTHLTVPPRDIIVPFWRKYKMLAYKRIQDNFEAKMAGRRV